MIHQLCTTVKGMLQGSRIFCYGSVPVHTATVLLSPSFLARGGEAFVGAVPLYFVSDLTSFFCLFSFLRILAFFVCGSYTKHSSKYIADSLTLLVGIGETDFCGHLSGGIFQGSSFYSVHPPCDDSHRRHALSWPYSSVLARWQALNSTSTPGFPGIGLNCSTRMATK